MAQSTIVPSTTRAPEFNEAADVAYGSFLCLCFLIGTLGNFVTFIYFATKKRDISSVIYMFITANDSVVSITVLPVGIAFLSSRQPGILFGNKYGCLAWIYVWKVAISLSVFLVLCLCTTRTISLLKPFKQQKIRYLVVAIVIYAVLMIARVINQHLNSDIVSFSQGSAQCEMWILDSRSEANVITVLISNNMVFTAPAFVVASSCAISIVVLTKKNENVQQKNLQKSRNKATVTILMFALLYGICNIPLVFTYIIRTVSVADTDNSDLERKLFLFDKQDYFFNTVNTLLLAANSAANPVLYFWRMPALREFALTGIRRSSGQNSEVGGAGLSRIFTNQSVLTPRASRAVYKTVQ